MTSWCGGTLLEDYRLLLLRSIDLLDLLILWEHGRSCLGVVAIFNEKAIVYYGRLCLSDVIVDFQIKLLKVLIKVKVFQTNPYLLLSLTQIPILHKFI
jgi:hypothetical protein